MTNSKVVVLFLKHGGLAVARSLGKHSLDVIGVTFGDDEFGRASRYIKEWYVAPHPENGEAFIDFLMDHAVEWDGALLFETNDYCSKVISTHKDLLRQHYKLISVDWEIAQIFLEKDKTYALADECGIPHPHIFAPQNMAELDAVAGELTFPVMLKPVESHAFVQHFSEKMFIADTLADLRPLFQQTLHANQPVMLSEIIPGTDRGTLERINVYINTKDKVAAILPVVKLRQTPPMFGVMRVGQSVAALQEATDYALQLLRHANYRGFANVEFKRDPRDNQAKLIEVNVRVPRGIALAIASGTDFPWIMYQDVVLDQQPVVTQEHTNFTFIDLVADLGNSLLRESWQTIRHFPAFISPYLARRKTFAVWSRHDPQPFFYMIKAQLAKFGQRLRHAASG